MDSQDTGLVVRPCSYPCPYHTACPNPVVVQFVIVRPLVISEGQKGSL
jgi:hypothetical protein